MNVSTNDLCEFVHNLGVTVLSCHLVKPRRTRWQQEQRIWPVRSTFRLCIPREETDKLLIADAWPDHVAISAWQFLKKVSTETVVKDPGSVADKDQLLLMNNRVPSSSPACSTMLAAEGADLVDATANSIPSLPLAPLSDNPFAPLLSAELMENDDSNILDDTDNTVLDIVQTVKNG